MTAAACGSYGREVRHLSLAEIRPAPRRGSVSIGCLPAPVRASGVAIVGLVADETNDEAEKAALNGISFLVERVYELINVDTHGDPVPGSRLHDVDSALGSFPLTHNVTRNLAVSSDHLHALSLLLHKAEAQLPFAGYTLLRASLEVVGQGMWLLSGGSRQEMIRRSLIVEAKNAHDQETAFRTAVERPDTARRYRKLQEIADRHLDVHFNVKKAQYRSTEALRDGPPKFGFGGLMLTAWQGTSGVAHGRAWAQLSLSDRAEVPGSRDQSGARFTMTSNTETLAGMFYAAVAGHEVLLRCFPEYLAGRSNRRCDVATGVLADMRRGFDRT